MFIDVVDNKAIGVLFLKVFTAIICFSIAKQKIKLYKLLQKQLLFSGCTLSVIILNRFMNPAFVLNENLPLESYLLRLVA